MLIPFAKSWRCKSFTVAADAASYNIPVSADADIIIFAGTLTNGFNGTNLQYLTVNADVASGYWYQRVTANGAAVVGQQALNTTGLLMVQAQAQNAATSFFATFIKGLKGTGKVEVNYICGADYGVSDQEVNAYSGYYAGSPPFKSFGVVSNRATGIGAGSDLYIFEGTF